MTLKLNLGCSYFKLPEFINIDSDPACEPEIVLDLKDIRTKFTYNSVDLINAGHILEHMTREESLQLLNDCFDILKPCCSIFVTVPNYEIATKTLDWSAAEGIILGGGEHKQIFNDKKLYHLFSQSNFRYFYNIGLENIPYMVVSNMSNPVPDPWQSTMLGIKL